MCDNYNTDIIDDPFQHVTSCAPAADHLPMTYVKISSVSKHSLDAPLLCLFDSGASSSWIKRSVLPQGSKGGRRVEALTGVTMAGTFSSNRKKS